MSAKDIVARLPLLGDGVPAIPGDAVWKKIRGRKVKGRIFYTGVEHMAVRHKCGQLHITTWYPVTDWVSCKEAAK
jgi:hypothetical protein